MIIGEGVRGGGGGEFFFFFVSLSIIWDWVCGLKSECGSFFFLLSSPIVSFKPSKQQRVDNYHLFFQKKTSFIFKHICLGMTISTKKPTLLGGQACRMQA